jgi:Domain of unknown function (DUF4401)
MDATAIWSLLVDARLAHGDMPDPGKPALPWYLRALAAVAAWLAAVCVLSSIGLAFLHAFDHAWSSIVVGTTLCIAGGVVLARAHGKPFVAQFGLAILIAGEGALGLGIALASKPHVALGCAIFAGVEVVMLVAIADRTHRALAALAATGAAYFCLESAGPISLVPPLASILFVGCALAAERDARAYALFHPAAAGVAVALLAFAPFANLAGDTARWRHLPADAAPWLPSSLMALVFVAVVAMLLRRLAVGDGRLRAVALCGAVAVAALAFPVPGLLAALVVMFVAFATGREALTGLGIVCALGMLGFYYYSLATTLLAKSASLVAVGAVLLLTGVALRHLAREAQGAGEA